jgi:parallel beta-helix repeat protein
LLAFNSQADVSGCDISGNGDAGIVLTAGSQANIDNNVINGNAGYGVHGYLHTTLVLHGNEIAYNSWAGVVGFGRTTIQIGGSQINYNGDDGIGLSAGSTLILEEPATTLIGNTNAALWCGDAQSYVNDLTLLDTEGDKGCLEFSW